MRAQRRGRTAVAQCGHLRRDKAQLGILAGAATPVTARRVIAGHWTRLGAWRRGRLDGRAITAHRGGGACRANAGAERYAACGRKAPVAPMKALSQNGGGGQTRQTRMPVRGEGVPPPGRTATRRTRRWRSVPGVVGDSLAASASPPALQPALRARVAAAGAQRRRQWRGAGGVKRMARGVLILRSRTPRRGLAGCALITERAWHAQQPSHRCGWTLCGMLRAACWKASAVGDARAAAEGRRGDPSCCTCAGAVAYAATC